MTNKLALAVAVVLGVLSIVGIKLYVDKLKAEHREEMGEVEYFVAAADLEPGQPLTAEMVTTKRFPRRAMEEALGGSVIVSLDTVLGTQVTTSVGINEVLLSHHFSGGSESGSGGLKDVLGTSNDLRAVSIPLSSERAVSGLLKPGDEVDITVSVPNNVGGSQGFVTGTLMERVRVIATDRVLSRFAPGAGGSYDSITVKVTPEQANKLIHCMSTGINMVITYRPPGARRANKKLPIDDQTLLSELQGRVEDASYQNGEYRGR